MKWLNFSCLLALSLAKYQEPSFFFEIIEEHKRQCNSSDITKTISKPTFLRLHDMNSSPDFDYWKTNDSWSFNLLEQINVTRIIVDLQQTHEHFRRVRKGLGFKIQFEEIMDRSPQRWTFLLEAVKTCEFYSMQTLLNLIVKQNYGNMSRVPAEVTLACKSKGFDGVPSFYSQLKQLSKLYLVKATSVWNILLSSNHSIFSNRKNNKMVAQCREILVNNHLNCFTPKCILKAKIDAFERMNLDGVTSNWLGCFCSYVRLTIWFLEEECNIDLRSILLTFTL